MKRVRTYSVLLALIFVVSLINQSCKQKEAVSKAKFKHYEKIAANGTPSTYTYHYKGKENTPVIDEMFEKKVTELSQNQKSEENIAIQNQAQSQNIKNLVKTIKNYAHQSQNEDKSDNKLSFKEKLATTALAFQHLKYANKLKKAIKSQSQKNTISLTTLLIVFLILLILILLLSSNMIFLLVLSLLFLLLYLLLVA